jgi:hypothetical protein
MADRVETFQELVARLKRPRAQGVAGQAAVTEAAPLQADEATRPLEAAPGEAAEVLAEIVITAEGEVQAVTPAPASDEDYRRTQLAIASRRQAV